MADHGASMSSKEPTLRLAGEKLRPIPPRLLPFNKAEAIGIAGAQSH